MKTTIKRIIVQGLLFSLNAAAEIELDANPLTLSTPNAPCKLTLPDNGWSLSSQNKRPDGTAVYYHYTLDEKVINFSVYIDQSNECINGEECLKLALTNSSYKNAKKINEYQLAGFHVAEMVLDLKELVGRPASQLNVVAEKYENGCWFDVHLSQVAPDTPSSNELLSILQKLKTY